MPITLDHLIVPCTDRVAAARQIAFILDVAWAESGAFGSFSPVYVNEHLTLDFDQWTEPVPKQHYAFRVGNEEFSEVLARLRQAGIGYRSLPHGPQDGKVNESFGGKLVYWSEPDGHTWEVLTVSYERQGFLTATNGDA
jgi:catechol 2,3-dioxygenase-like lactoylglutathione lyase family enzyme